jgi:hypothetical protein
MFLLVVAYLDRFGIALKFEHLAQLIDREAAIISEYL